MFTFLLVITILSQKKKEPDKNYSSNMYFCIIFISVKVHTYPSDQNVNSTIFNVFYTFTAKCVTEGCYLLCSWSSTKGSGGYELIKWIDFPVNFASVFSSSAPNVAFNWSFYSFIWQWLYLLYKPHFSLVPHSFVEVML